MGKKPAAIMLKKVLAVLALVLALGYAQGPAKFSTCGADALGVTGVIVDPNSPIPGKNLTVSLTIKPTQDIVDGDQFVITVKVFGVALGHVDFNTCKDLGITCPLKAGTAATFKAVYPIPSAAPGGVPLTAELSAKTSAGAQYSCIDVPVTKAIGTKTGAYSVCIPTGPTQGIDTINGFLMNMDDSIDLFAKKIKADKNLANGFNAAGF